MTNDPQSPPPGEPTAAGNAEPAGPQYGAPSQPAAAPQYGAPTPPPPPPTAGYGQAPSFGAAPSGVGQPADLGVRFLARLIDFVILAVVNLVIVSILIVGTIMGDSVGFGGVGAGFAAGAVSAIVSAVIYVGYFAFLESSRGQTVGKMVLKLRTVGADGNNPTMEQAIKRNAWAGLGILGIVPIVGPLLGGLLQLAATIYIAVTINSNTATHQGWHDQFAGGTKVIKVA